MDDLLGRLDDEGGERSRGDCCRRGEARGEAGEGGARGETRGRALSSTGDRGRERGVEGLMRRFGLAGVVVVAEVVGSWGRAVKGTEESHPLLECTSRSAWSAFLAWRMDLEQATLCLSWMRVRAGSLEELTTAFRAMLADSRRMSSMSLSKSSIRFKSE